MKAAAFDYVRAGNAAEVSALLADETREARILAGGQSLVPMMAFRLARPRLLIDINDIASLSGIRVEGNCLVIGATTRQQTALACGLVEENAPLLARALAHVGHRQTRNRGTVGGSLAHGDPAAEIGLAARVLGAEVVLRTKAGERRLAIDAFQMGAMETALQPGEWLTEIRLPTPHRDRSCGVGFQEIATREGDFALLAAAAEIVRDEDGICREARVGLANGAPTPLAGQAVSAALVDRRIDGAAAARAAREILPELDPPSDAHADAAYRRRIAPELLARAILEAAP